MERNTETAQQVLLEGLIDYAGVFPPAELALDEALTRYEHARSGDDGWVLGPCLLKASQLTELARRSAPRMLGAVLDMPVSRMDTRFQLAQVEMKVQAGSVAEQVRPILARTSTVYAENIDSGDHTYLNEVAELRAAGLDVRGKVRTGGTTAAAFPSVEQLADFIAASLALDVPFKATAGLHHPFRHASDIDGAKEHGFINVMAAVRAALAGEWERVREVLAATEPEDFDPATATWRGVGETIDPAHVRGTFRSFGSCSFDEPALYLHTLGLLPVGAGA